MQHLQSQATGKMEELTQLTIKIGTMSQREAIAMRIITVVTLIYLPATFVSVSISTQSIPLKLTTVSDLIIDILQHRHRQVPKSKLRWREHHLPKYWSIHGLILRSSYVQMAPDHTSIDISYWSSCHCRVSAIGKESR